jgi:tetratricopeptide (TPR) repeat protein
MDIWRWVHTAKRELRQAGHDRLATLMDDLPSLVCNDDHGRVEAVVPEAIALARAARQPWVEVFVRHWALQSRVLHRWEAQGHLAEAVALLEYANRDETRQCPQSVCVTQDLASCYACADGPRYVSERLAVAAETLARIDPTWPCFQCISDEYASALQDDERHQEVLEFLQAQTDRAATAGVEDVPRFVTTRVAALLALGRADEAWALMQDHEAEANGGTSREVDVELVRARVLAALGRADEAVAVLPSYDVVFETPSHYDDYLEAVVALVRAGRLPNDATLGVRLRRMLARAERNGARWLAARLAVAATQLAAERGAFAVAREGLVDVERIRGELGRPERVSLDALRQAVATAVEPELPASVDEVRMALSDDAEAGLERLVAARRRWPDDETLVVLHARALVACALEDRAEAVLRQAMLRDAAAPEHAPGPVVVELGRTLLGQGRHDALRELVAHAMQGEALRASGLWLLASSCMKVDDVDGAAEYLEALLAIDPDIQLPRHRLASLELRRGRHAEALAHLDRLVLHAEPGELDWDRMTAATIVGDWQAVRDSARRLGIELEGLDGEGPLDASMGLCRLRFVEEDGTHSDYFAERRSPVCARVVQMAGPRRPEHFDDLVAFDAGPLNPRAEGRLEDAEGREHDEHTEGREHDEHDEHDEHEAWIPIFPVVHVVSPGGFRCWSIDGVHPGQDAWAALVDALEAMGGVVDVRSDEGYQHEDPEREGERLAGVYAYACMPKDLDPGELHARLGALTQGFAHPVVWPELCEALPAGEAREQALRRVAEVTDRYAL